MGGGWWVAGDYAKGGGAEGHLRQPGILRGWGELARAGALWIAASVDVNCRGKRAWRTEGLAGGSQKGEPVAPGMSRIAQEMRRVAQEMRIEVIVPWRLGVTKMRVGAGHFKRALCVT